MGLHDEQARAPSLLPGWSVGHVLTHIARNGDSLVWRLEGAAQGELRDQYPGGLEQRRADIEAGAGRPASELVVGRGTQLGRGDAGDDDLPGGGLGRAIADIHGDGGALP